MIFVGRDDEPDEAITRALARKVKGTQKTEIDNAREYYESDPPPTTCYSFARYKTRKVVAALDKIYKNKCAYCESHYQALAARNIEHYRPKGGVNECDGHRGYWWLAGTWSNLLPSCLACNQARTHTIFDERMTLEDIARLQYVEGDVTSGKGNAFPMKDGAKWAENEGPIDAEDPLLINPSVRNPEDHMEWKFKWEPDTYLWESEWVFPFLFPKTRDGEMDPYGKASIAIYGLNRLGLFKYRMERLEPLRLLAAGLVEAMQDLAVSEKAREVELKKRINDRWEKLQVHCKPESAFTAMNNAYMALLQEELKRMELDSKIGNAA